LFRSSINLNELTERDANGMNPSYSLINLGTDRGRSLGGDRVTSISSLLKIRFDIPVGDSDSVDIKMMTINGRRIMTGNKRTGYHHIVLLNKLCIYLAIIVAIGSKQLLFMNMVLEQVRRKQ
jgi:hypothetical protein